MEETVSSGFIRASAMSAIDAMVRDTESRTAGIFSIEPIATTLASYDQKAVTLHTYNTALETASHRLRFPEFAFLVGLRMDPRVLGPAGYALLLAPTVGDALRLLCRDFSSVQSCSTAAFDTHGSRARITYQLDSPKAPGNAQDAETSLGVIVGFLKRILGEDHAIRRLVFAHSALDAGVIKQETIGIPTLYDRPTNYIEFDAAVLNTQIPGHDPQLLALTTKAARNASLDHMYAAGFLFELRHLLLLEVEQGRMSSLGGLARQCGCAPRTLQARLSAAGTTLRQERNDVVMTRARQLLKDDSMSVTETALELGYSETSAFSRAYRAHFGRPPSQD